MAGIRSGYASTPLLAQGASTLLPGVSPLQTKVLLEGHLGHMARLMIHGTEEALWPREKRGPMAFPQFWYRATGKRAFIAQGPRRYTRHTVDLKELGYETEAARWRCKRARETCRQNRALIGIGSRLGSFTGFRNKTLQRVRELESAPRMTREAKQKRINALYSAINRRAEALNSAINRQRKRSR